MQLWCVLSSRLSNTLASRDFENRSFTVTGVVGAPPNDMQETLAGPDSILATTTTSELGLAAVVRYLILASQAAWYRMENGPKSKNGKKWPKNGKWPLARNGEKMAQKRRKNRKMTPNPIFSPCLGHFFPISGRGPFSIFRPFFSHFWISAHFPFYTRRPDSQEYYTTPKYWSQSPPTA